MHLHLGPSESTSGYVLLDPENDIVASAVVMIAKVVVETDGRDFALGQEICGLTRPTNQRPAIGIGALIV